MSDDHASNSEGDIEAKFRIGWQKLTKQEFVEALTMAVLDKVRSLRRDESEKRARAQVAGADSPL
ncbi:MAG TPA: hypothetical protein VG322_13105 [Candidatus Acidoferrales bacterium]|jgi:hypothetical protein|nr:hypothetical protein [Candidatus Acidoferrales bacterium]